MTTLRRALTVLAAMVLALGTAAVPAQAQVHALFAAGPVPLLPEDPGCIPVNAAIGLICFYDHFGDDFPTAARYFGNEERNKALYVVDDITSYVANHTGNRWMVSSRTDCTGELAPIYPDHAGLMSVYWNNKIGCTYRTSQTS